jgi:hypothetical protein
MEFRYVGEVLNLKESKTKIKLTQIEIAQQDEEDEEQQQDLFLDSSHKRPHIQQFENVPVSNFCKVYSQDTDASVLRRQNLVDKKANRGRSFMTS